MRFYFLAAFVFVVASTVSGAPTRTSASTARSTATLGSSANDHTYALAARLVDEDIQLEARYNRGPAFRGREHEYGYRPQHYGRAFCVSDVVHGVNKPADIPNLKKKGQILGPRSRYDEVHGAGGRGTSHRRFKSRVRSS